MAYELVFFEDFIGNKLPQLAATSPDNVPDFDELATQLKTELKAVKIELKDGISEREDPAVIQHYITNLLTTLTMMADDIYELIDEDQAYNIYSAPADHSLFSLCKVCYRCIDQLIMHLFNYHQPYFNTGVTSPRIHIVRTLRLMRTDLRKLEKGLAAASADPELVNLALDPSRNFIKYPLKNELSLSSLSYHRNLLEALRYQLATERHDKRYSKKLRDLLYSFNHNSEDFLEHCRERIREQIELTEDCHQQLVTILAQLAEIRPVNPKPGYALRGDRPSLQQDLTAWLEDQQQYYRHLLTPAPNQPGNNQPDRLAVALTVEMIGYIVRIFFEAGLLKGNTIKKIIAFFATHFRTKRAKTISAQNLHNNFYEENPKIGAAFRKLLIEFRQLSLDFDAGLLKRVPNRREEEEVEG